VRPVKGALLGIGVALGLLGILLNSVTFVDSRSYAWAVPAAIILMVASTVTTVVYVRRVVWPARVALGLLLLILAQQLADAALRRLPFVLQGVR
jgi:hypothetical protein